VVCTAQDGKGGQATCGFTVTVNGAPQAFVVLEGGGPELDFGPITANKKSRKAKKQPDRNFTVENRGCLPLVLTLNSISRVGNDIDRGRISDPDDSHLFSVNLVSSGVETELDILEDVRVLPGEKKFFKVRFNPVIPTVANATRHLKASQVLPSEVTSQIVFTQNGGNPIVINLLGHVDTEVRLTDPTKPKRGATIVFSRVANEFVIEYTIYDSNLNVKSASYQFFDRNRRIAGNALSVSLTELIQQAGFVTGQSFTIEQHITGASDHGEIVGVQVTVTDPESSDRASSSSAPRTALSTQSAILKESVRYRPADLILPIEDRETSQADRAAPAAVRPHSRKEK
jgi:hypothetical protein